MVWPMLAGLFGSLLGGGAAAGAAGGGLSSILGGATATAGATGAAPAIASSAPASASALEGIMSLGSNAPQAGPMSIPNASVPQMGIGQGTLPDSGGMSNWGKILESVEGDFESEMGPQGKANMQRNMQPQGIMDASQPAWGLSDFQQRFNNRERGKRAEITQMGLMHPYVSQLLGGG